MEIFFNRLICNRLYEFFIENELISSSQSGINPGDSGINQLLSTHNIYRYFDNGFENRGVFVDNLRLLTKFDIKVLFIS